MKAEDSGYYTCTATNTWGFDTIIVNLLVQGELSEGTPLPPGEDFVFRIKDCLTSLPQSAQLCELLQLNVEEPGDKEADPNGLPFQSLQISPG